VTESRDGVLRVSDSYGEPLPPLLPMSSGETLTVQPGEERNAGASEG